MKRHRAHRPWAWTGLILLAVLALPPVRTAMEAGMAVHMLIQFPALMLAGTLLACGLPPEWRAAFARWNALGLSGLAFVALTLAGLMIPRVLDLALTDAQVELAKWAVLLGSGMALSLSWRASGAVVQAFFLGNVLPMMAVVGLLYQDTPLQLCNAYRMDEQQWVGFFLAWGAAMFGAFWMSVKITLSSNQQLIR